MAKRGRPRGTMKDNPREHQVGLPLSADELVLIEAAAQYEGLTVAGYVRRVTLLAARAIAEKSVPALRGS